MSGRSRLPGSARCLLGLLLLAGLLPSGVSAAPHGDCPVRTVAACPHPPSTPGAPDPTPTPSSGPEPTAAPGQLPAGTDTPGAGTPARSPPRGSAGGRGSDGTPFPTPKELVKGALTYIVASISDGITTFISAFNDYVYGLPAPGTADAPSTWADPSDGWWPGVWAVYLLFVPLGVVATILAATLAIGKPATERRERLRSAARALFMIGFGWYIAAAALHLGDTIALVLAPSGTEFLATPEGIAKLGLGFVLGVVIAIVESAIIVWALIILFVQYFLAHVVVAFWPLFWGFRALPSDIARPFGDVGIAGLATLVVLKLLQAGVLRLLFEIPWGVDRAFATLLSLAGTAVGLVVATVVLPGVALKKMLPAAMVVAGKQHTPDGEQIEQLRERARERIGGVRERYRSSGGNAGGTTDRRQIGTVQRRVASFSRPGGRAGTETRSGTASGWGSTVVGPAGQRRPPEHDNRGYR